MKREREVIFLDKERGKFSFNIFIFLILILSIFSYLILKTTKFEYFNFLRNALNPYIDFFNGLFVVLIIFSATYLFIDFTKKLIQKYLKNVGKTNHSIRLFLVVYEYFIWIFIIILTFSIVLKQGASLITSIGLIGFGLTLALQKPILNFAGWLTIVFSRMYQIGDIVTIGTVTGEVYDIRVMYTSLSELNTEGDPTGKAIFMPNEFVFSQATTNYTKGTPFVWDSITFHITYKSNWKKALKIIEKTVQEFYNKNIKTELEKTLKDSFGELERTLRDSFDYEDVITRINAHEKGITIKVRYLVDFNKANNLKAKLTEILLDKLAAKDIMLGKTESIN